MVAPSEQPTRSSRVSAQANFTIAICTRNRRDELVRCLESVAVHCSERRSNWEVVVVDNSSSDRTHEVVTTMAEDYPLPLRCVIEERIGIANARNRAMDETVTDVVVFLDDDITLTPGWFGAYEEVFQAADIAGAGGRITPVFPESTPPDYISAVTEIGCGSTGLYDQGDSILVVSRNGGVGLPHGANMALRLEAVRQCGSFRSILGWGEGNTPCEETDLFRRLIRQDQKVLYLPRATVHHHLQPSKTGWKYLRRWHIAYGRASVLMRPKPSLILRLLKIAEQATQWARHSITLAFSRRTNALALRKVWNAQGRMAQLLNIKP